MKDMLRNPILYYILVPVAVALWPLLLWGFYLPRAENELEDKQLEYGKDRAYMLEILKLDPERATDVNDGREEFDYTRAVNRAASMCKIAPSNYRLSASMPMKSGQRKSQSAKVTMSGVGIVKVAKFLSGIQVRWADLQCEGVKLTKKKGLPDLWDADLDFKYYY